MRRAAVEFVTAKGTYSFSDEGSPQWGQHSDYEAQGDGPPKIKRTTYTIVQTFDEQAYGDNEARIQRLRAALDAGQGKLVVRDESGGTLVEAQVKVRSDDVPRAWRQYTSEVTIVFEAREVNAASISLPATFTPVGGSPVTLPNVTSWKVGIRVGRFSTAAPNRDEAIETVTASGFILVDQKLDRAARLAFLQRKLAEFRTCNAKEGVLKWGAEASTVRVDSLDPDLGDGQDRMTWSLVASRKTFPAGTYAQPEYTVTVRRDYGSGDLVTAVRGRVKADTEAEAHKAITALKASYAGGGRTLENDETSDACVGGVDGAAWLEVSFGFEYRETISGFTSSQWRITTREEAATADKTITYEGRVTGGNSGAALATAREIGFGKLPMMLSSSETVASKKNSSADEETFVEVAFSYVYATKAGSIYAEVSREVQGAAFSDQREIVSGFVAAATIDAAKAMANSFRIAGRIQRESTIKSGERIKGEARQAQRVDFTFVYYLTPTTVSIAYGEETTNDFTTLEKSVVVSGVVRGPTESACNAEIDAVKRNRGGKLVQVSRKSERERQGSGQAVLIAVTFTVRLIGPADDEAGVDIVAASYSVRTQYSVNKTVLTTIPYGTPHVQQNVGIVPGVRTISGTVTARRESTARGWGRSKRGLLQGGHIDQIEDDMQHAFAPLDGEKINKFTYSFTFSARYPELPFE